MILLLPAGSAVVYSVAVVLLKRAIDDGVGPWRTNYVVNTGGALVFATMFCWIDRPFDSGVLLAAGLSGFTFFSGQIFTFLALSRGDVSIATPVLGTKVLFVALFTSVLLNESVPVAWWIAAATTSLGIALLQWGGSGRHHAVVQTIVHSTLAALAFSLTDVLVQRDVRQFGAGWFIPVMFLFVALYSQSLIFLFRAPLRAIPARTLRVLLTGTALISLQALGMAVSIGLSGQATAVNIIYNSRGLWSIVIVWLLGRFLGSTDSPQDRATMLRRVAGALLILAAIALALLFSPLKP